MLMSNDHYFGLIIYWMRSGYLRLGSAIHLPFCTNILFTTQNKEDKTITIYISMTLQSICETLATFFIS
jgi:hypothetical protein